jgi:5'-3' exonuclease
MDCDFLQLVSDENKTMFYSPMKKILFDERKVISTYGCHPANFLYRKIILGDGSDNIKGIRGVGEKTIQK